MTRNELNEIREILNAKANKIFDEMETMETSNTDYLEGKIAGIRYARQIIKQFIKEVDE